MVLLRDLTTFLDELLSIDAISGDKSNNGLQIEGKQEVRKIVGGVDGCLALYDRSIDSKADFIFVHHGESWGTGLKYFTGHIGKRFERLFSHHISLYAAHLPLDAHTTLGHNIKIAGFLDLRETNRFGEYAGTQIGVYGHFPESISIGELKNEIDRKLSTRSIVYNASNDRAVRRIGIISGCGASALHECKILGIDCLVTGEFDHTSYHPARELDIAVIAAGHYKTEIPGIDATLQVIYEQFEVDCQFIDIPTNL